MSVRKRKVLASPNKEKAPKKPPELGSSPEAVERKLVNLAVNLAERQMRAGTASAQVITHFLKLGTLQAQVDLERARLENQLITAKTEQLTSQKKVEELMVNALTAFKTYTGNSGGSDDDSDLPED